MFIRDLRELIVSVSAYEMETDRTSVPVPSSNPMVRVPLPATPRSWRVAVPAVVGPPTITAMPPAVVPEASSADASLTAVSIRVARAPKMSPVA